MNATPMRFQQGDTLSIRDDQGQVALWLVIERKRRGYLMRPQSGSDARTWSDDEIDIVYGARRLTHHPCNADGLPKAIAETLEKNLGVLARRNPPRGRAQGHLCTHGRRDSRRAPNTYGRLCRCC